MAATGLITVAALTVNYKPLIFIGIATGLHIRTISRSELPMWGATGLLTFGLWSVFFHFYNEKWWLYGANIWGIMHSAGSSTQVHPLDMAYYLKFYARFENTLFLSGLGLTVFT